MGCHGSQCSESVPTSHPEGRVFHAKPCPDRVSLRKTDLAGNQRRRRAGQGLHRALRRRRAARAAPAARRRPRLSRAASPAAPASRFPTRCWCCRSSPTATPATSWISPARSTTTSSTSCTTCSTSPSRSPTTASRRSSCSTATARTCRTSTWSPAAPTWRPTPSASLAAWWNLLTVDKDVPAALAAEQVPRRLRPRLRAGDLALSLPRRRQRPQGPDQERHHQLQRGQQPVQLGRSVRAPARRRSFRGRAATRDTGVLGEAELATAEKGRQAYEEAVKQLVRFVTWFKDRPKDAPQGPAPQAADHADPVGPAVRSTAKARESVGNDRHSPSPYRPGPFPQRRQCLRAMTCPAWTCAVPTCAAPTFGKPV